MFFLFTRLLATASAAVAVLAMWFSAGSTAPTNIALAEVIRPVLDAQTLHLRVLRDGLASNVYVQHPGLVRWEDSPTQYRVASGTSLWRVDGDKTEQETAKAPWIRRDGSIDLLSLLDLAPSNRPTFDHLRPAGRSQYAGHEALVFTRRIRQDDQWLRVDLYADAETKQFLGAAARDASAAPKTPPIAELTLVAMNQPLAKETFAVAQTLNVEGLGKVTDVQGIVTLRPLVSDRWTIVCRETPLQKGDWVRTNPRGAHAAKLVLNSGTTIILGPGTVLEVQEAGQVRLTDGECQVERAEGTKEPFTLVGLGDAKERIDGGKHLFRITSDEKLVKVPEVPLWLKGFEGATANESIGSLIVTVDGRSEPLTVGEHKVTVDIRDQIARTTIEETFVNRTGSRLEGQFHFPLPQDASISGFGMWIGNQLVEADIVEKQRAREIFETILRENRDPGLLEWAGGNVFKARVFPIEPHSEKRIKITYTQVLPLRANRYRYSYGLRSEMLQKFPLRDLSIQVNVHSAMPLKSVACPTYACRSQSTANSARLDFTASEFTPPRDFEVVCEFDGSQSQVVVVPHRRGDDGYLLLQLMPPGGEGNWQREVLPSGAPADLLILCDTSGSMDSTMRKTQAEFVTALLSSLGPKDRFNVGVCDVETTWLLPESMTQKDEVVAKVQSALAERPSLGWSDLDKAIASALNKAQPGTQIVYVGDGIVSGLNSDPQAFAVRVKQLAASRRAADEARTPVSPTIHSVSVGSTYESVALKGMASIGGGSVRQITGDQTPAVVANELLNEILQPGLKDLAVEFKGFKVAAVYPERLPNLPAGMQQILVGRYLPEGDMQSGEVVVTGKRGNEAVRYVSKISFPNKEEGNSFIPRLWARAHLDQLLMQGSSPFIQDEIIRLSEEFHIITPYTSLLVLETDADRERFGVRKRYEMRDGERFFADGKAAVRHDLAQQQMKRAGAWRQGLRRQILAAYAQMGRSTAQLEGRRRGLGVGAKNNFLRGGSVAPISGRFAGGLGGAPVGGLDGGFLGLDSDTDRDGMIDLPGLVSAKPQSASRSYGFNGNDFENEFFASKGIADSRGFDNQAWDEDRKELAKDLGGIDKAERMSLISIENPYAANGPAAAAYESLDGTVSELDGLSVMAGEPISRQSGQFFDESRVGEVDVESQLSLEGMSFGRMPAAKSKATVNFYKRAYPSSGGVPWLELFPMVSAPRPQQAGKAVPGWWPAEAIELSRLLDRREQLNKLPAGSGLEIVRTSRNDNDAWRRMIEGTTHVELASPGKWLDRETGQGNPTTVHWADGKERGILSVVMHLGRVRPVAEKGDEDSPLSSLRPQPLHEMYREYIPSITRPAADRFVLELKDRHVQEGSPSRVRRLTIDTLKKVLLQQETLVDGKVAHTTIDSDHLEVGGIWFPTRTRSVNSEGREVSSSTQTVTLHSADAYTKRFDEELAVRESCLLIRYPVSTLAEARRKINDGQARTEDRLLVMAERTARQQWDDVFAQLVEIEKANPDRPGLRWVRIMIERTAGRNEEARQHLLAALETTLKDDSQEALARVTHILDSAYSLTGWEEYTKFVAQARPVFERQKDVALAMHDWKRRQHDCLRYTGKTDEFLALFKEWVLEVPGDVSMQTQYATTLAQSGRYTEAYAWLDRTLEERKTLVDRPREFSQWELHNIHMTRARLLREQTRWPDLVTHLAGWVDQQPTMQEAYSEYLSALVFDNQITEAERTVRQWFAASQVERKMTAAEKARFDSARSFALNDISHVSSRGVVDPVWLPVLEEAAKFFLVHEHHQNEAFTILQHYRFQGTDAADRVRGVVRTRLNEGAATLPVIAIQSMVGALLGQRCLMIAAPDQLKVETVSRDEWDRISKTLRVRWDQEPKLQPRRTLAAALTSIYANQFSDTEHLPFLRARVARDEQVLAKRDPNILPESREEQDDGDYLESDRSELYEALLARPWTEAIEEELFALLPNFGEGQERSTRLTAWIVRLQQLVDRMLAGRKGAAMTALKDSNEAEKLTRTELLAKQAGLENAAREGLVARLASETAKAKEDADRAVWFRMERGWLDVLLERNLDTVWGESWELLGATPTRVEPKEDWTDEQLAHQISLGLLRSRAWATAVFLATKPKAPAEQVDRVLAYLDAGIKLGGDVVPGWRMRKLQFLIALDRPERIEAELRTWIHESPKNVGLRLSLAKIRAELGDVPGAITLLEEARKEAPLGPLDLAMLTDLYLAADRKEDYRQARLAAFEQIEEWRLSNMINQFQSRLQQHGGEVSDNLLLMFEALFSKASNPEGYLYSLRGTYQATRDFRVLRMVPDIVMGRTRETTYLILANLDSNVLWDLKEAAADELLARVRELRARTRTAMDALPADQLMAKDAIDLRRARRLDLRALDLIEALVERRSSEVPNQGGVHAQAALAALKRAFDGDWEAGERRQMATVLRNLGHIQDPELAAEQVRELEDLIRQSEPLSDEALLITSDLAHVLHWHYGTAPEAFRGKERAELLLASAIRDRMDKEKGNWPPQLNSVISEYVSELRDGRQYTTAEELLTEAIETVAAERRPFFNDERFQLWLHALQNGGRVSLGEGEALFTGLLEKALERVRYASDNERYTRLVDTSSVLRAACERGIPSATAAVKTFAFETYPKLQTPSMQNFDSAVSQIGTLVGERVSRWDELRFYIAVLGRYPAYARYSWNDGWNQHAHRISALRHELAGQLGELEAPLLRLVLERLRNELITREGRTYEFTRRGYQYFWAEKTEDFAKISEEVLNAERNSPRIVAYVADYLFYGLDKRSRAIEVMFIAHRRGILDNSGINTLGGYLNQANRYAEAAPLYELLVDREPENLGHRTHLMGAYHQSKRPQQVREVFDRAKADFQKKGLWTDIAMGQLAEACYYNGLQEEARQLYTDAISRRQRSSPTRGMGDLQLTLWYKQLASTYANLHKTPEAVEAASGAIVCWPRQHNEREAALETLRNVIQQSTDLDAYVAHVDAEAARTGQDGPIIRAAIGKAWQARNEWDKAIAQYQIARRLQPNNRQVNDDLLACFDAKKDPAGAARQLLAMVDYDRHNIELLKKLTDRTKELPDLAERAATSLVEASPNEAENHQALAELRQSQGRWNDAVPEWEQVAELRKLEPTGLVRLAAALIQVKQFDRAAETLTKVRRTAWPSRFDPLMNELPALDEAVRRGKMGAAM